MFRLMRLCLNVEKSFHPDDSNIILDKFFWNKIFVQIFF